jgi:predicted lipid-binding transport protein (Tim44 family)
MRRRLAERVAARVTEPVKGRLGRRRVAVAGMADHPVRQREVDELLKLARMSFVQLQAAWDRADLGALSHLTTQPLLEELRSQLAERGPGPNHTEVLRLDARLLRLEELQEAFVASVEFSGLIREQVDAGAAPFRELWLLARPKAADAGWQLARVQSLS